MSLKWCKQVIDTWKIDLKRCHEQ